MDVAAGDEVPAEDAVAGDELRCGPWTGEDAATGDEDQLEYKEYIILLRPRPDAATVGMDDDGTQQS
uniref:Uncharacterized protein n=1 Tax=Oryza rufipogon TaxID=4529 RepID=A0A0E0PA71_ORYRU